LDLYKTIRVLSEERQRLDKLIASLELLKASEGGNVRRKAPGRRGRKGMSAAERKEISERMKKYWAARRAAAGSAGNGAAESSAGAAESAST
jgi:hypothetical protein